MTGDTHTEVTVMHNGFIIRLARATDQCDNKSMFIYNISNIIVVSLPYFWNNTSGPREKLLASSTGICCVELDTVTSRGRSCVKKKETRKVHTT